MVICLERGADLHLAQLMPLPLTVSCFSKIQIGFTFLVLAHPGSPGQRAVKRVCVCVCVVDTEIVRECVTRPLLETTDRLPSALNDDVVLSAGRRCGVVRRSVGRRSGLCSGHVHGAGGYAESADGRTVCSVHDETICRQRTTPTAGARTVLFVFLMSKFH